MKPRQSYTLALRYFEVPLSFWRKALGNQGAYNLGWEGNKLRQNKSIQLEVSNFNIYLFLNSKFFIYILKDNLLYLQNHIGFPEASRQFAGSASLNSDLGGGCRGAHPPEMKTSFSYSLLKFVYLATHLRHSLLVRKERNSQNAVCVSNFFPSRTNL